MKRSIRENELKITPGFGRGRTNKENGPNIGNMSTNELKIGEGGLNTEPSQRINGMHQSTRIDCRKQGEAMKSKMGEIMSFNKLRTLVCEEAPPLQMVRSVQVEKRDNLFDQETFGVVRGGAMVTSRNYEEEKRMKNEVLDELISGTKSPKYCCTHVRVKAEYKLVSEDQYYCAKCAVHLVQKGFKVEEIMAEPINIHQFIEDVECQLKKNQGCKQLRKFVKKYEEQIQELETYYDNIITTLLTKKKERISQKQQIIKMKEKQIQEKYRFYSRECKKLLQIKKQAMTNKQGNYLKMIKEIKQAADQLEENIFQQEEDINNSIFADLQILNLTYNPNNISTVNNSLQNANSCLRNQSSILPINSTLHNNNLSHCNSIPHFSEHSLKEQSFQLYLKTNPHTKKQVKNSCSTKNFNNEFKNNLHQKRYRF